MSDRPDHHEPVSSPSVDEADGRASLSLLGLVNQHAHYPNAYAWLLLFSAMDIMLTWVILYFGGREINPLADWILGQWNLNGMIVYKFVLILLFIGICEVVATQRESTARLLSRISILIAAFPVVWSLLLLARYNGLIG